MGTFSSRFKDESWLPVSLAIGSTSYRPVDQHGPQSPFETNDAVAAAISEDVPILPPYAVWSPPTLMNSRPNSPSSSSGLAARRTVRAVSRAIAAVRQVITLYDRTLAERSYTVSRGWPTALAIFSTPKVPNIPALICQLEVKSSGAVAAIEAHGTPSDLIISAELLLRVYRRSLEYVLNLLVQGNGELASIVCKDAAGRQVVQLVCRDSRFSQTWFRFDMAMFEPLLEQFETSPFRTDDLIRLLVEHSWSVEHNICRLVDKVLDGGTSLDIPESELEGLADVAERRMRAADRLWVGLISESTRAQAWLPQRPQERGRPNGGTGLPFVARAQ